MNFHRVGLLQDSIELNPLCQPSGTFVDRGRSMREASF